MRRYRKLIIGFLLFGSWSGGVNAEVLKPVLPLSTALKLPAATGNLANDRELIQSKDARKKALIEFKEVLATLNRPSADSTKQITSLRQAATKLGPGAKLLAELTAARVTGGVSINGAKSGKPAGVYRGYLLSAGNIAAKIDDNTHEQTALYAIALWRKIEGNDAPWTLPPLDAKAQKKFAFMKAIIERQALYEWQKDSREPALKKYRALSVALNATSDGAAIDLRLLELERNIYKKSNQPRRWQKALIEMENKYQDPQFLGVGQESKTQKVRTVVAVLHKGLVDSLIKDARMKKAEGPDRKKALDAIELYLNTNIDNSEKERIRVSQGEIEYDAENHKAAAGIFAALATESQDGKANTYWRKAIRSQTALAKWPMDVPWKDLPKGNIEPREVLIDMYKKIDGQQASDWQTVAHIGLLMIANNRADEAYGFWTDRLNQFPSGQNASYAVGWIVAARVNTKQWSEVETLGRIMVKANLSGKYLTKTFSPKDVLGLGLIEGGLTALSANDFKTAITKLAEYVKGWRKDARHDEGMYHLSLSYQGDRQFRLAVQELETFTKLYPKSKWRHDALINGGAWTLALTWDEHVIFFLETHAKEFPTDERSKDSLTILTDVYMGREIYDSALRVMTIQLLRKDLDAGTKIDIARRVLDTAERHASPESALKTAEKLLTQFRDDQAITANALSLKARILAAKGNVKALVSVESQTAALDQSTQTTADILSEVRFLLAETMAKSQFKDEVFSLGSKDPKAELENGYRQFTNITQMYKSSCSSVRTSWCGPALHRSARIAEAFVRSYGDITIAKTLDPEIVKDFYVRKKAIIEGVESMALEADEKSMEQAKIGATNPDWTAAILWQNGGEWSREKFTSEAASHFIQWHTR